MKPPATFQAWDRIVFPDGRWSPEPDADAWRELYDRCFDGEHWRVEFRDAYLLASSGIMIAFAAGRYDDLFAEYRRLLEHPDATEMSDRERSTLQVWIAAAELAAGVDASATLRSLLKAEAGGSAAFLRALQLAAEAKGDRILDPSLTELVRTVFRSGKGRRRKATLIEESMALGELRRIMEWD